MFEQTFKNIDDVLWKEAGCGTELDYTEQTSWLLFLKYLDDLEQERAQKAELVGKSYEFILDEPYRWSYWAVPKLPSGEIDRNHALISDDLINFVNDKLFPYLKGFNQRAASSDTIEYKIGEIFKEIKNKFQSGYSLRDALERIDELRFQTQDEKHELSHLYETKIKNMGNAGRNGGEYYTPRPLIRAMIKVVKPKIGDRIYDGACGSAGFLCESYDYLRQGKLTTQQLELLQTKTFVGKEKKSLAYVIAIMNMILHGIDAPEIIHTNTLTENLSDIEDKDRFSVILANPPFGGKERPEVQQNFPIKTGETAFLFLQHFIKILKVGGRAAIVIKNTFLSNSDNASRALRQELLSSCNLHTILDCPGGTFIGAGVKTVVLFFDKSNPIDAVQGMPLFSQGKSPTEGMATRKVWYYQLDPGRNMGKTNPLNDDDLREFVELQATFADSEKSWSVDVADIDWETCDLSVKNPNKAEETALRDPQEILDEIAALDEESAEILAGIGGML
ncbi:type I restriction-modification system subunit M [Laspinema sp. D1]|uniref:site-specific DNA-methyltransferase (adenine-specific) n=1 Tax=Laspinema palackyanum D2a TaxID=2953684 RepID=A0ABT2N040_9CYAN|nr:type I restriction-modification system subunit M [Laspinema sp. D2a]